MDEPLFTRLWSAIRPPAPPRADLSTGLNRSQRRLLGGTAIVAILAAIGWGTYAYFSSAPDRAGEAYQAGLRLAEPGKYQDAVAQFSRAIDILPTDATTYLQRGLAYVALNQTSAAE